MVRGSAAKIQEIRRQHQAQSTPGMLRQDGNIIEKRLGCKAIQRWCDVRCGAADKRLIDEYPAANAGLPKYQRLKGSDTGGWLKA